MAHTPFEGMNLAIKVLSEGGVYAALKNMEDLFKRLQIAEIEGIPLLSISKNENITHDNLGNIVIECGLLKDQVQVGSMYLRDNAGVLEMSADGNTWEAIGADVTPGDIGAATQTALDTHTGDTDNPHAVTAAQLASYSTGYVLMDPLQDSGFTMPSVIGYTNIFRIGSYLYCFAGATDSATIANIYRASVSDPTTWIDTGATLPTPLDEYDGAVIGDFVYIIGGFTDNDQSNKILRAPVSDPTTWTDTGATLPVPLYNHCCAVIDDGVYLFGGSSSFVGQNTIYYASTSDPTTWTDTGATLPVTMNRPSFFMIGDYVYLAAVDPNTGNHLYRAFRYTPTIWTDLGAVLPETFSSSQAVIIGDRVYLIGGSGGNQTTVLWASVHDLMTWTTLPVSLPEPLAHHQAFRVGETLYVFGSGSSSKILTAKLDTIRRDGYHDDNGVWYDTVLGRPLSDQETLENLPWRQR